jgi:uncharacterized protein (TIRG00374 family)
MPGNDKPPLHKSKSFQLAVGIAISVLCLAWAFWKMTADDDPRAVLQKIGSAFAQADYRTLPLIWGILFVFYWLKAWRWRMLLSPLGRYRPLADLLPSILIGFAFNNLLPFRLGEFVRPLVFSRRQRLPMVAVLASVALERVLDLIALLVLLVAGLFMMPRVSDDVRRGAVIMAVLSAGGVIVVASYLAWTRPFVRIAGWCLRAVRVVPDGLQHKITSLLEAGAVGLSAVRNGRLLPGLLFTSFAQWALNALIIGLSLHAFAIDVPWFVSPILAGVVAFAVAVPSAPGFFGIVQVCFLAVLELFTVDRERVFAASIYFHLLQYIPVTLSGFAYFSLQGLKVADVRREAEQEQTDPGAVTVEPASDPS